MPSNKMTISWETSMPSSGLKPNSIYIIDPGGGNLPQVFVTNKTGSTSYRINPTPDLTSFIKKVNNLTPDANGAVQMDLSFTGGNLSLTGSGVNINLSATYVEKTAYNTFVTNTNNRLDALESTVTNGLKTPVAFNASANATFPSQTKGFTYKVTVAGTTSGIALQVGDTIIYDTTGTTPFIVQANVDVSTTSVTGLIMLATQAEVDTGTNSTKAVVPSTLQSKLNTFLTNITASNAETLAGSITNKFVTPASNLYDYQQRKATQTEVNVGTDDTKYVTPLTLQTKISTALASVHTHSNKAYLDKIGESATGEMTYNGDAVYTVGSQAW